MNPRPQSEGAPAMGLRFSQLAGLALLLAAALFALALALGSPSPPGVGAHPCNPNDSTDLHKDFQAKPVPCSTPTLHQKTHTHTIEVDGGRYRDMDFKAYVPSESKYYDSANDKIVITFHRSFDLTDPVPSTGNPITVDDSGTDAPVNVTKATVAAKKLTLTGGTFAGGSSTVETGEYVTITIKAGAKIETPETPQGFDNFEGEKPYEVTITFVNGDANSTDEKQADDKNYVIVKNPLESTVPNDTVRVELHTYAEGAGISTADDITVDFSGPSADSGFVLPGVMTTSRIKVFYIDTADSNKEKFFNPSEVQVEGERVTFSVPTKKDDAASQITFEDDYRIEFSRLARIKNPFSAGIKTIKVSSTADNDEDDIIEAVVRRTTTVNPREGPRGSEFTMEGKGYAAGTVTIYHDADGEEDIDPGETLASVKTLRGAFRTKLTAGGRLGDPEYTVTARDSEGQEISVDFTIRSAMYFEPPTVGLGSSLKIIISDWEKERNEVVAAQIAGEQVFIADAVEYEKCIEHPNAARRDSKGDVTFTVNVPINIPPGEQTVSVYDHYQLDYENADGDPVEGKESCTELTEGTGPGQHIGPLKQAIITDDPIAITKATVEVVAQGLTFSRSEAARGQRVTISGSGFARGTGGGNVIESVTVNGNPVAEDPRGFKVTASGNFAFTVTVPVRAANGANEVRVEGTDNGNSLATGTLTVPAASIELDPPESRRGEPVRVTGAGFIANRPVWLQYGDGGGLGGGDIHVGSAMADGAGGFDFTFTVPVTAEIGRAHKVTAMTEVENITVRAEAVHSPPGAAITTAPEQAFPGDALTISGRNLPAFALVRSIDINGIHVTPQSNLGTDGSGAFEAQVVVPWLELGDQLLRVEVAGGGSHPRHQRRPPLRRPPAGGGVRPADSRRRPGPRLALRQQRPGVVSVRPRPGVRGVQYAGEAGRGADSLDEPDQARYLPGRTAAGGLEPGAGAVAGGAAAECAGKIHKLRRNSASRSNAGDVQSHTPASAASPSRRAGRRLAGSPSCVA